MSLIVLATFLSVLFGVAWLDEPQAYSLVGNWAGTSSTQDQAATGDDGADNAENKRASATVLATLASQLITAGMAVLAVVGAFVTFTLDKRNAKTGFFICTGSAALLIFFSIFFGALGLDKLQAYLFSDNWTSTTSGQLWEFRLQTMCLGLAILVLPFSFAFFGSTKEDQIDRVRARLDELSSQMHVQQQRLNELAVTKPSRLSKTRNTPQKRQLP